MNFSKKRWELIIPVLYLLGAGIVWVDFSRLPPDGLANVGIALYTLPDFVIMRFISGLEFPFVRGGYYEAHAIYFFTSVGVNVAFLHYVISAIRKILRRRSEFGIRKL